MAGWNKSNIMGHAGQDADVRQTKNGKTIVNLSVAVTVGWGEHEDTVWTKIRIIGPPAEWMSEVRKGDTVVVLDAEYNVDKWQDKDGNERRTHYFLSGKGSKASFFPKRGRVEDAQEPVEAEAEPAVVAVEAGDGDNVPF